MGSSRTAVKMITVLFVVCILGSGLASPAPGYGYQPKCRTVYDTTYKHECSTSYAHECKQVGHGYHKKQQCYKVPKQECRQVPVHKPVEKCHDVPKKECKSVPVQVPDKKCTQVPKESCKQVPVKKAVQVPSESCKSVPKESCTQVASKVPKKVPVKTAKKVCDAPSHHGGYSRGHGGHRGYWG